MEEQMPTAYYLQVFAADTAANELTAIAATDPLSLSGIRSSGIFSLHVRSRCSGAAIYRRGWYRVKADVGRIAVETATCRHVWAQPDLSCGFADRPATHVSRYILGHSWRVLPGLAAFSNE